MASVSLPIVELSNLIRLIKIYIYEFIYQVEAVL
jgi:hypothetical protein